MESNLSKDWIKLNYDDIQEIYDRCIPLDFDITLKEFILLAFLCTDPYNNISSFPRKHIHPKQLFRDKKS